MARVFERKLGVVVAGLLAAVFGACSAPSNDPNSNGTASGSGSGSSSSGVGGSGVAAGVGGATGVGGAGVGGAGVGGAAAAGGTTGVGGAAAGGAAGSAGAGGTAAVVQKDCATKTALTQGVFADFEGYDGTVTAPDFVFLVPGTTNVYAGSYYFDDDDDQPAPWGETTFSILAGHASNWGLSLVRSYTAVDLQPGAWGATAGLWFGCIDASAYTGVSFWVRGSVPLGTITVVLPVEDTNLPAADPAGGGTCPGTTDTCKAPFVEGVAVTTDWTQVTLPWAMFTAGDAGGTAVPMTGNEITGMQFAAGLEFIADPAFVDDPENPDDMPTYIAVPAAIDLKIDDITFTQ